MPSSSTYFFSWVVASFLVVTFVQVRRRPMTIPWLWQPFQRYRCSERKTPPGQVAHACGQISRLSRYWDSRLPGAGGASHKRRRTSKCDLHGALSSWVSLREERAEAQRRTAGEQTIKRIIKTGDGKEKKRQQQYSPRTYAHAQSRAPVLSLHPPLPLPLPGTFYARGNGKSSA